MTETKHAMATPTNRTFDPTIAWLGVIIVLGVAYRAWLAASLYPLNGDPTFSYCYRALLIESGDFRGVTSMWQPPGLSLLLALMMKLGFGLVGPYGCGVALSLASYVGLAIIVDRLIAPRVTSAAPRLVAACFIAFYETLAIWAVGPLTEPIYLLLVYAAVMLLDRQSVSLGRAVAAGLLIGVAFTVRFEAAAPAVGLSVLLLLRRQPRALAGLIVGGFLGGGWLLTQWEFLKFCSEMQRGVYTIPPVHGLGPQIKRLIECVYYAATVWLPLTLLLPYWILSSFGLLHDGRHAGRDPQRPSLHASLFAVVLPSLALVTITIMHKRTGSFLLPAAAIWTALGVEMLIVRFAARRFATLLIPAAVVALLAADMGRTFYRLQRSPHVAPPSFVAASILAAAESPAGKIWAFGMETEIYTFREQAIFTSFRDRDAEYDRLYLAHQGRPDEFTAALRAAGYRYLVIRTNPPQKRDGDDPTNFDDPDVGTDLRAIIARADALGLKHLGSKPVTDEMRVDVYELVGP